MTLRLGALSDQAGFIHLYTNKTVARGELPCRRSIGINPGDEQDKRRDVTV
jgi:hypothetical protein